MGDGLGTDRSHVPNKSEAWFIEGAVWVAQAAVRTETTLEKEQHTRGPLSYVDFP